MTLQEKYDALETKHKNLRGSVSFITQELRELPAEEDGWAHVSSFGIYMQLLQALMGAAPPEPEDKRFRRRSIKTNRRKPQEQTPMAGETNNNKDCAHMVDGAHEAPATS